MAEIQELEAVEQEIGEIEAVEQKQEPQKVEPNPEDDLPEEFRGKSVKDLVGMTIHARKEMGRQANELGEIRKLADELIKSQLKPKVQEDEPKEVDFFENPQEAVRRAVETNPEVQMAKQYAIQAQQNLARQKLAELHPDYQQVMQDKEFADWAMSSPIRKDLLVRADQQYDVSAANELFSTFKELKAAKTQQTIHKTSEVEQKERDLALKSVAVDAGGSGETTRKVYRRADLIKLKMTDPARYDAMNDEILAAYAEGRVR